MRRAATLVLSVLAGCAPANPCGGPAPAIEDCVAGLTWADCGGVQETPAFACQAHGDCRWFAGGCVAEGYTAAPCNELPPLQFEFAWGNQPWDAVREAAVTVVVGTIDASAPRPVDLCVGTIVDRFGCDLPPSDYRLSFGVDQRTAFETIVVAGSIAFTGYSVEILPGASGAPIGRVCTVPTTDVFGGTCDRPMLPPTRGGGECAVSGTVTLDASPVPGAPFPRADVSVVFADGGTLELRL